MENIIKPKIIVAVWKRPLSEKEQSMKKNDIIEVWEGDSLIVKEKWLKVDLTKYI